MKNISLLYRNIKYRMEMGMEWVVVIDDFDLRYQVMNYQNQMETRFRSGSTKIKSGESWCAIGQRCL